MRFVQVQQQARNGIDIMVGRMTGQLIEDFWTGEGFRWRLLDCLCVLEQTTMGAVAFSASSMSQDSCTKYLILVEVSCIRRLEL